MKKTKLILPIMAISLLLASCRTSPNVERIAFLDEQEASFYCFGKESTILSQLKYYSDIVPSEFPDIETNPIETEYIAFGIDVKNKEDEITIPLLNQIYDYLESEKYVFVYFMNYDDLSVLRRSKFKEYSNKVVGNGRIVHEILIVYNYHHGFRHISDVTYTTSYHSEEHKTEESLYSSVLWEYYSEVTKILTDQ